MNFAHHLLSNSMPFHTFYREKHDDMTTMRCHAKKKSQITTFSSKCKTATNLVFTMTRSSLFVLCRKQTKVPEFIHEFLNPNFLTFSYYELPRNVDFWRFLENIQLEYFGLNCFYFLFFNMKRNREWNIGDCRISSQWE